MSRHLLSTVSSPSFPALNLRVERLALKIPKIVHPIQREKSNWIFIFSFIAKISYLVFSEKNLKGGAWLRVLGPSRTVSNMQNRIQVCFCSFHQSYASLLYSPAQFNSFSFAAAISNSLKLREQNDQQREPHETVWSDGQCHCALSSDGIPIVYSIPAFIRRPVHVSPLQYPLHSLISL